MYIHAKPFNFEHNLVQTRSKDRDNMIFICRSELQRLVYSVQLSVLNLLLHLLEKAQKLSLHKRDLGRSVGAFIS